MQLTIGQKVAYPNQGICLVEGTKVSTIGGCELEGYTLRVLGDRSTIFIPKANAESVGIRPIISTAQCKKLVNKLSEDFEPVDADWKVRSREFIDQLQSGDIFEAADVLKKLTFLSFDKKLSFREQTMLEKAKFLIISEVSNADIKDDGWMEAEICRLVEAACAKHRITHLEITDAAA